MNIPFINIHKHTPNNGDHELSLQNIFLDKVDKTKLTPLQLYSVGLHPWHLNNIELGNICDTLTSILTKGYFCAIGEIGIDKAIETPLLLQEEYFYQQVKVAKEHNLPIIIHNVRAQNEILKITSELSFTNPVIFHGFNGNYNTAKFVIDNGGYISFGIKQLMSGQKVFEISKKIPKKYFFLETDDKDIMIENVYIHFADILNISRNELKEIIFENFDRCFSKE